MAPSFFSKFVKTPSTVRQDRASDSMSRPTSPTSSSMKSDAARARALSSPAKPSNSSAQPSFRMMPPQYSPSSTSLSSDPSVTVIPPSPQSHTSSFQSEQNNMSAPKERGSRNRPAALPNLNSSPASESDSGMPTPTPTSNRTLGFDGKEHRLAPSSSMGSLRDRVRSVVSSRSSSRSRSRIEPTAPSSSAPSGPQFAANISAEPHNVEEPLAQTRANSNGPRSITAPFAESDNATNEYRTSSTSSVPTPTQAIVAGNQGPVVPESQFLSPTRIRDSDSASISSSTSARKRRLWRRSSTASTASPKQQRSTGLASALVASMTNSNPGARRSSSPAAAVPDTSRRSASSSSTPASPPRRKGIAAKRSPALSGHHAAASQSSVDLSPGTHSRNNSLSIRALEQESDYVSSADGQDDEVEDDSEDDALLEELNDGDIPVTGFAVASNKRNADFHELFRSIPEGDYLIEDYGCALQREILVQGRIYISENHICFHANIFGWVTDLIVPIYDIVSLEKKMTAFVIPNAIQITTRTTKYTFASFLARDTAYDVIYNIWRLARPEDGFSEAENVGRSALDVTHTHDAGVPPNGPGAIAHGPGVVVMPLHKVTQCECGREGKHYSELAMDVVLPGTPERIYNLMFASGFLKDFMRVNQKLEDIQMSDWAPTPGDQNCLARNMSYIKPLNGSIGPRATKCEIHDETVHSDFDDYITMVTTTRTPDVPSGGVFSVKTRTCVTWASSASSRVVVTSQVEWTGRSFIKGIIERSAIEGQKTYQTELVRAMRSYIQEHQTEFIPAGLNPADLVAVVQEPPPLDATQAMAGGAAGEGDEAAHKAREQERDRRGLQWAYDTLEGALSVARQSAAGAIELLRDAWGSQFSQSSNGPSSTSTTTTTTSSSSSPSTSTILYAVIAVLVLSNLWTLTLVGKRDNAAHRKDPRPRPVEEREKWVQGIVTALWQELEAGHHHVGDNQALPQPPPPLTSSSDGFQSPPFVPPGMQLLPGHWREEVAELGRVLDAVEERVRAVRQSLAELD